MITYDLLLVIFALCGVILTFSSHEYLVITGDIIACFCFVVYLLLFILWQSIEIKAKKKQLKEKEHFDDFVKYLHDKMENKDE